MTSTPNIIEKNVFLNVIFRKHSGINSKVTIASIIPLENPNKTDKNFGEGHALIMPIDEPIKVPSKEITLINNKTIIKKTPHIYNY